MKREKDSSSLYNIVFSWQLGKNDSSVINQNVTFSAARYRNRVIKPSTSKMNIRISTKLGALKIESFVDNTLSVRYRENFVEIASWSKNGKKSIYATNALNLKP